MIPDIARGLIIIGVMLIIVGAILIVGSKIPGIGRLPGDILMKRENITFYFPITTSIIVSIALSVIFYFFHRR